MLSHSVKTSREDGLPSSVPPNESQELNSLICQKEGLWGWVGKVKGIYWGKKGS